MKKACFRIKKHDFKVLIEDRSHHSAKEAYSLMDEDFLQSAAARALGFMTYCGLRIEKKCHSISIRIRKIRRYWGLYMHNGRILISSTVEGRNEIYSTLVHELCHYFYNSSSLLHIMDLINYLDEGLAYFCEASLKGPGPCLTDWHTRRTHFGYYACRYFIRNNISMLRKILSGRGLASAGSIREAQYLSRFIRKKAQMVFLPDSPGSGYGYSMLYDGKSISEPLLFRLGKAAMRQFKNRVPFYKVKGLKKVRMRDKQWFKKMPRSLYDFAAEKMAAVLKAKKS